MDGISSEVNPHVEKHEAEYAKIRTKSPDLHTNCCSPKEDDHQNVSPATKSAAEAAKNGNPGSKVPMPNDKSGMSLHCPE
jgi:hypothetical protein